MKTGYGECHGTFGELVQGVLDDQSFLLTFPLPELKTKAVFTPQFHTKKVNGHKHFSKAILACEKLIKSLNLPTGGILKLYSTIPRGKGMASSTADIVAAMRAVADSYSINILGELISKIASEIEPTDGVMYEHIVAYDYLNGTLIEPLGELPPYQLIGFDIGGTVDTILFNQQQKNYSFQQLQDLKSAYDLVKVGIKHQYLPSILNATTMSAKINQNWLPKPFFNEIDYLSSLCQGGIVIAHSGTMMGILYDPMKVSNQDYQKFNNEVKEFAAKNKLTPSLHSNVPKNSHLSKYF
ncbi:kinase [Metabacillus litoralis]|uniref:GHMP family kinase ATP-binding protein n=1 Tax=Metabacillus litoralis TaxID=152268 RepID=UPI001CFEF13E|nr:kinase [Metabacillus litoralis]